MDNQWKCIVLDSGIGGAISDTLRRVLVSASAVLYHSRYTTFRISSPVCEGVMTTTWQECNIERVTGFVFKAKVETVEGYHELSILVAEEELKLAAEMLERGITPIANLENPDVLSPRMSQQAHFYADDTVPKRTN